MDTWSAKDLKAYIEKHGGSHADCVEKSDLVTRAKSLGGNAASSSTERKVTSHVKPKEVRYDYGFLHKWRRVWASHENKARVEAWMGFHVGLRSSMAAMSEMLNDAVRLSAWMLKGGDFSAEAVNSIDSLVTNFKMFATRIADHAAYEDQSLFPFFIDLLPDFKAQGEALTAQHQEMDAMEVDITENATQLKGAIESRNESAIKRLSPLLLGQFSEYQQLIIEHLATEENSLIGPWLHLTAEEYNDYREKYLVPFGHGPQSIPVVSDSGAQQTEEERAAERRERERREEEDRQKAREKELNQKLQEERKQKADEQKRKAELVKQRAEEEAAKQRAAGPPKLYDRHGREVDMTRPGCCFDGVDGCCKGSAYQRLLAKSGYVLDPKTGTYVLKK